MQRLPRSEHLGKSFLAGGRGFEPRLTVPETAVLPLDEPPTSLDAYSIMAGSGRQISSKSSVNRVLDFPKLPQYYPMILDIVDIIVAEVIKNEKSIFACQKVLTAG